MLNGISVTRSSLSSLFEIRISCLASLYFRFRCVRESLLGWRAMFKNSAGGKWPIFRPPILRRATFKGNAYSLLAGALRPSLKACPSVRAVPCLCSLRRLCMRCASARRVHRLSETHSNKFTPQCSGRPITAFTLYRTQAQRKLKSLRGPSTRWRGHVRRACFHIKAMRRIRAVCTLVRRAKSAVRQK